MFNEVSSNLNFPEAEMQIREFWEANDIYEKSLEQRRDGKPFVFFEGPPTANGLPHPGHCLTRAMKDLFPRYKTMTGHYCLRKGGWDTHGLPVEVEVCKELGIHSKEEIEAYGVEPFNRKCLESVFRYTQQWETMTKRLGFWVNLEEAYVTYHKSYVESVWWSLKQLFDAGLLYQGHKIVWWWAQGGTALSAGEVGQGYREVDDPSVYVRFPVVMDARARNLLGSIGVPPVRNEKDIPKHKGVNDPVSEILSKRQRILPHWEMGGSTYFLTFRLDEGELSPEERTVVLSACRHWDEERIDLHAVVVMPDHVHLLCTPLEKEPGVWWSIADLMHSIKGFTARAINESRGREGNVWQREYYDRIVRSESDFREKWNYVVSNPSRKGFDDDYAWLWVEDANSHRRDADAPRASESQESRDASGRDARTPQVSLLVWTTTPWTLPSNMFAAVHNDFDYAVVHDTETDERLIFAEALVPAIAKKCKKTDVWKIEAKVKGSDLVGLRYVPPFPECFYNRSPDEPFGTASDIHSSIDESSEFSPHKSFYDFDTAPTWGEQILPLADKVTLGDLQANRDVHSDPGKTRHVAWRVVAADFVTLDSGTGLVHEAPAFGEVDYDLWKSQFTDFTREIPLLFCVAPNGTFTDEAPDFCRGRWVKEADKDISRNMKERGLLLHQEQYRHDYPFCWRADQDPLIQYPRESWFIRTTQFKDDMLGNNQHINWLPDHIKTGRFGKFLESNVDWSLSRERYWGTPLPIWVCNACGHQEAIDSYDALCAKPNIAGLDVWENAKNADPDISDHLKVHKPYIDAVTYQCPTCANDTARMQRVTEVIDCWYDSGAMPFAQWGWPHKSHEMFAEQFPANFISEALDQTRGWFYSLTAISVMLFGRNGVARDMVPNLLRDGQSHPFETCIVLGLLLGEDGLKMSKSKKNYKQPDYIFDNEGADAMRWLFFSGQAPWTSIRFQESAIAEGQREFLIRLYNCYTFFVIYANIDKWTPASALSLADAAKANELDRWILSELAACSLTVFDAMEAYDNYSAARKLNEFVDALSNWYVRRCRDRFWRSEMDADKNAAYTTLHHCLVTLTKLIAPFTPFIADTMYQNLVRTHDAKAPESVHLCDYPVTVETRADVAARIDEACNREIDIVRQVVSCGRAARSAIKVRVRQPLATIELFHREADVIAKHEETIQSELNVKAVQFVPADRIDQYVHYDVKPDFKLIGPKYGPLAPKIRNALVKHPNPDEIVKQLEKDGVYHMTVDGQDVELTGDELKVELHAREGYAAERVPGYGIIVLDTHITPELRDEGSARDLVNQIQQIRKKQDLKYEQQIELAIVTKSDDMRRVINAHAAYIQAETLAKSLLNQPLPGVEAVKAAIDDHAVEIFVRGA